MDKPITILTFTTLPECAIVKGLLESEGISSQIKDELSAQMNYGQSASVGGVKLQVEERDVEQAVTFLESKGHIHPEDYQRSEFEKQLDRFVEKLPPSKLVFRILFAAITALFIFYLFKDEF